MNILKRFKLNKSSHDKTVQRQADIESILTEMHGPEKTQRLLKDIRTLARKVHAEIVHQSLRHPRNEDDATRRSDEHGVPCKDEQHDTEHENWMEEQVRRLVRLHLHPPGQDDDEVVPASTGATA